MGNFDYYYFLVLPICCRGHVNDMSRTCQYRGGVSFSPVNLVSKTCQGPVNMGPFGNTIFFGIFF